MNEREKLKIYLERARKDLEEESKLNEELKKRVDEADNSNDATTDKLRQ